MNIPPPRATVLLVNKFFYPRAGAETAFFHTRDLLLDKGHRVIDFAMQDERNIATPYADYFSPPRSYDARPDVGAVKRARDASSSVYSWSARRALARLLDRERPDVAHLHNIYHQLTLSLVDELYARRIPLVQTLHDWKIACPAYTLFTEGEPCRRCLQSNVLSAIRHRCVKGSSVPSAVAALEAAIAHRRGTYLRIDRFIAPSRFAGEVAMASGVPPDRVRCVPYLVPDREMSGIGAMPHPRDPVFVLAGRLEETKGVRQLLAAFERVPPPARLRIAGSGALEGEVRSAAARSDNIEFLGALPRDQVLRELGRCRALVLPSVWEDNCPLVILEAQAHGTAAIVSDRGGPPEFVRDGVDGFVVDPEDTSALVERIGRLSEDAHLSSVFGDNGRRRLLADHAADTHYESLLSVYGEASARHRNGLDLASAQS